MGKWTKNGQVDAGSKASHCFLAALGNGQPAKTENPGNAAVSKIWSKQPITSCVAGVWVNGLAEHTKVNIFHFRKIPMPRAKRNYFEEKSRQGYIGAIGMRDLIVGWRI